MNSHIWVTPAQSERLEMMVKARRYRNIKEAMQAAFDIGLLEMEARL